MNPKMAKTPENVWNFIDNLIAMSKKKANSDIDYMKNMLIGLFVATGTVTALLFLFEADPNGAPL